MSYIGSEKLGDVCLEEKKRAILDHGVLPLEGAQETLEAQRPLEGGWVGEVGGGGEHSGLPALQQPLLCTRMALRENGNPEPKGVSTASPQASSFANWQ